MRSIYAIFKREVKAYFTLPIAYVMMGGTLVYRRVAILSVLPLVLRRQF